MRKEEIGPTKYYVRGTYQQARSLNVLRRAVCLAHLEKYSPGHVLEIVCRSKP